MIEAYDDSEERASRVFAAERRAGLGVLPRLGDYKLEPRYSLCEVCGMEECFGHEKEQDKWELIQEDHFPQCPTYLAAKEKRISTLCMCAELEKAENGRSE